MELLGSDVLKLVLTRLPRGDGWILGSVATSWRAVVPPGITAASVASSVERARLARAFGCRGRLLRVAVRNRRLDCVEWLLSNPLIESACATAAQNGRLEVLKWLRAQNCPWGNTHFVALATVRPWAIANGCYGHSIETTFGSGLYWMHFRILPPPLPRRIPLNDTHLGRQARPSARPPGRSSARRPIQRRPVQRGSYQRQSN